MKKLTKDQIQKILLSALMMIGLIYCYFTFLIAGLTKADTFAAATIDELDANIAKAKTQIKRSSNIEEQSRTSEETLAQVNDMIPEGAPVAWFPPRMNAFFARHNIKGIVVHSTGIEPIGDPALKDYRNGNWTIDIPQVGANTLGIAVAGLENEEKLVEVMRVQISTQPDAPEKQRVALSLVSLLK